jgi:predicted NUDIX family NTP pyrophosphohydrolase
MPKRSAGLLLYRSCERGVEVFLVHPGGPYFARKDLGAWSVPKGEHGEDEQPLAAALREFAEETGRAVSGTCIELGVVRQAAGKLVTVFALEGDFDPAELVSNTCQIEWPPRSGRRIEIPEVDRGAWFTLGEARARILASQAPVLDVLVEKLGVPGL